MYKRILAAIDSTPQAQAVIAHTQYLARLTEARAHVLHVHSLRTIHASLPVIAAPAAGVAMASLPPADLAVGAAAHRWVDQAVERLLTAGIIATGEVLDAREERAAEFILQRAQQMAVQLIVLGAQHRKRLLASLRPAVTDRVCRRLCCAVLVVP